MHWIGLTGGIASGKSTVASLLRTKGYSVIDADDIARSLTAANGAGLRSVVDEFGKSVLTHNGELDRKKMAELVFSDPQKLKKLESLLHPLVQQEVALQKGKLKSEGAKIAFYDVPLLFEKSLESQFEAIVVVTASEEVQKERLRSRNQFSDEEIARRLANQIPLREKEQKAHFVIQNHGSLDDLEHSVDQMLKDLAKFLKISPE